MQQRLEVLPTPTLIAPILIVEDDPGNRQLLETTLHLAGLPSCSAADGAQALAQLARHCPSVVLLDLRLPDTDAETIVAGIRTAWGPTVPIVVISADRFTSLQAAQLGACAWLRKPFHLSALLGMVQRALALPAGGVA